MPPAGGPGVRGLSLQAARAESSDAQPARVPGVRGISLQVPGVEPPASRPAPVPAVLARLIAAVRGRPVLALPVLLAGVLVVAGIVALAGGFGPRDPATPTPTVSRGPGDTPIVPIALATHIPSPQVIATATDTATPTHTASPSPTSTPTGTSTWTPTPTSTWTPTPTPTLTPTPACAWSVDPLLETAWDRAELGCPRGKSLVAWSSWAIFERGYMLWRDDTKKIYVLHCQAGCDLAAGSVGEGDLQIYKDGWDQKTIPEELVTLTPPPERFKPVSGFGYTWVKELRAGDSTIGWATQEVTERGFCAKVQYFDGGTIVGVTDIPFCDNKQNMAPYLFDPFRPFVVVMNTGGKHEGIWEGTWPLYGRWAGVMPTPTATVAAPGP